MKLTERQHANFWRRVKKTDTCWLWTGYKNSSGYGLVRVNKRKNLRAHRISWMISNGRAPNRSEFVCHSCDNPPCVNPAHLWIGDAKSNVADCIAKGRKAKMPVREKLMHCKRGHPMVEGNIYFQKSGRACRTCARAGSMARKLRIKEALKNLKHTGDLP